MKPKNTRKNVRMNLPRLLTDLANMRDDGVARFRRTKEGRLYQRYKNTELLKLRDELRMLWPEPLPKGWEEMPADGVRIEDLTPLQRDWLEHRPHQPLEQFICEHWLFRAVKSDGIQVDWTERKLTPNAKCLPVVLLWGCLQNADRLAYCHNPECAAPFFIGKRKDQQFCSDGCAEPAKRAAKLRWWNANRAGIERKKDPGQM